MEQLIEYQKSYQEYKAELDSELQRTAEGFVRIGYLLKVARDTNVLAESGYKTVAEFAEAEYNLDKTQVSRFISINDKFSEGGYSDHLLSTYQGFGYAKLTLMLQLPEAVNEALTPEYSKAEIQAIKDEIDEEKKISDIEVVMEAKTYETKSLVEEVVYKLGQDNPELFTSLFNEALGCSVNMKHFQALVAPSGEITYSVRCPGIGRILLMLNDTANCRAVNSRTGEAEVISWEQLRETFQKLIGFPYEMDGDAAKKWSGLYCEPYPLIKPEEKVAPVQQNDTSKKPTNTIKPKSESKDKGKVKKAVITKTKQSFDKSKDISEKKTEAAAEEQIPGQTELTKDFTEYMPDSEDGEDEIENVTPIAEILEPEKPTNAIIPSSEGKLPKSNRERCREALHQYIDSLDDEGMYDFIDANDAKGEGILSCDACEDLYGKENCHMRVECKRRFMEWINE